MHQHGHNDPDAKKLYELIKDVKIAMMTTVDTDGKLHSRPMYNHGCGRARRSLVLHPDLALPRPGNLPGQPGQSRLLPPGKQNYVSVAGKAEIVRDKAKIDEKWSERHEGVVSEGQGRPGDRPAPGPSRQGRILGQPVVDGRSPVGYVKAAVTGERADPGDHAKVDLTVIEHCFGPFPSRCHGGGEGHSSCLRLLAFANGDRLRDPSAFSTPEGAGHGGHRDPGLQPHLEDRPDRPLRARHGFLQAPDGADDFSSPSGRAGHLRHPQPHHPHPPRRHHRRGRIARAARPCAFAVADPRRIDLAARQHLLRQAPDVLAGVHGLARDASAFPNICSRRRTANTC